MSAPKSKGAHPISMVPTPITKKAENEENWGKVESEATLYIEQLECINRKACTPNLRVIRARELQLLLSITG